MVRPSEAMALELLALRARYRRELPGLRERARRLRRLCETGSASAETWDARKSAEADLAWCESALAVLPGLAAEAAARGTLAVGWPLPGC